MQYLTELSWSDSTPPRRGAIRASAVQMVFASRLTQGFITPEEVQALERWVGRTCLDALTQFEISEEVWSSIDFVHNHELIILKLLHPVEGSVWA
jgi:hypothetical protein